jgi:hypothetical protein
MEWYWWIVLYLVYPVCDVIRMLWVGDITTLFSLFVVLYFVFWPFVVLFMFIMYIADLIKCFYMRLKR